MPNSFSPKSGLNSPMDLIPKGFLCWCKVTFTGMKTSQQTGSRYGEIDLTVADNQPFARKKIFTRVGDPDFEGNTQAYRDMGMAALTRMMESANLVDPNDAASYEKMNGKTTEQVLMLLDNKYVAIKVKVDIGKDGYNDKNEVGEYLTPNPATPNYKLYVKLTNGDHGVEVTVTGKGPGGFGNGGNGAPAVPAKTGFGSGAVAQTPPAVPERQGFNPNAAPPFLSSNQ